MNMKKVINIINYWRNVIRTLTVTQHIAFIMMATIKNIK